jgi:hypothetical protein
MCRGSRCWRSNSQENDALSSEIERLGSYLIRRTRLSTAGEVEGGGNGVGKEGGERDGGASSERSVREKGRKRIERHTKI